MSALLAVGGVVTPWGSAPAGRAATVCDGTHLVGSWMAAPTDSITPVDASGGLVPSTLDDQTVRTVITPHLAGHAARVELSNEFGLAPVTFGAVSVGEQARGSSLRDAPVPVTFRGRRTVTVPAGARVVSDVFPAAVRAFRPVAVSVFVTGVTGPPTKHWNANATSFVAGARTGDATARVGPLTRPAATRSWLYVTGLSVIAPASTQALVAFGDSITDGFVGATPLSIPADTAVADTQTRYPDLLQRRFAARGLSVSVLNAGISSNRILASGSPLMLGPSGEQRFTRDVLTRPGVSGVLIQEGINDLGLPLPRATASQVIAGLARLVERAHRAGVRAWLGTLLPSSGALVDGEATAPGIDAERQRVNTWIRRQRSAAGVVDFDRALRDPARPAAMRPDLAGPDNLHPNARGYAAMAAAVDDATLAEMSGSCGRGTARR